MDRISVLVEQIHANGGVFGICRLWLEMNKTIVAFPLPQFYHYCIGTIMDLKTLLGTTFDCVCGKRHHIPTEKLFYSRDVFAALEQAAAEIIDGQHYLIVADQRTWEKARGKVA